MAAAIGHDVMLVPSQFRSIQDAVDAVVQPSTIVVSPGVYEEDLWIAGGRNVVIESVRFGRRGVTLAGAGAETVVQIDSAAVVLSGIEIRSDQRARAIAAANGSVSLQECVLAGNRVTDRHAEAAGAGMLCVRSFVRIQKSTISGNSVRTDATGASGGGLHLADCKVEIAGSSIQTNAVYAPDVARGGGIWCERAEMRMWRSRVTDNALYAAACQGAGLYLGDSAAQLGGSVITGNGSADGKGGGIFIRGNAERVAVHRNTVVRQNHPADLFIE